MRGGSLLPPRGRRGRDLNPRPNSSPGTRFPVALLRPLGHLSEAASCLHSAREGAHPEGARSEHEPAPACDNVDNESGGLHPEAEPYRLSRLGRVRERKHEQRLLCSRAGDGQWDEGRKELRSDHGQNDPGGRVDGERLEEGGHRAEAEQPREEEPRSDVPSELSPVGEDGEAPARGRPELPRSGGAEP